MKPGDSTSLAEGGKITQNIGDIHVGKRQEDFKPTTGEDQIEIGLGDPDTEMEEDDSPPGAEHRTNENLRSTDVAMWKDDSASPTSYSDEDMPDVSQNLPVVVAQDSEAVLEDASEEEDSGIADYEDEAELYAVALVGTGVDLRRADMHADEAAMKEEDARREDEEELEKDRIAALQEQQQAHVPATDEQRGVKRSASQMEDMGATPSTFVMTTPVTTPTPAPTQGSTTTVASEIPTPVMPKSNLCPKKLRMLTSEMDALSKHYSHTRIPR
ncbi:hypothetical protein HK097_009812 [Rhizophlyctis rosea]|uniref:Uncharacterized protein n=1 Tax=Rhizophlyctis rosea TaxID=64517 RepID=A0AAD5S8D7_9FUNG|nr:hypothetical protein HK097_009812 [Rhizophlyctis rosea]